MASPSRSRGEAALIIADLVRGALMEAARPDLANAITVSGGSVLFPDDTSDVDRSLLFKALHLVGPRVHEDAAYCLSCWGASGFVAFRARRLCMDEGHPESFVGGVDESGFSPWGGC